MLEGLGDPTQIVWAKGPDGIVGGYYPVQSTGGGGGLPTGWTQDADDPSNVQSNGDPDAGTGGLAVGAPPEGSYVQLLPGSVDIFDSNAGDWFSAGYLEGVVSAADAGASGAFIAQTANGQTVALYASGMTIDQLEDPSDPQQAATKAYVDSHGGGGDLTLLDTAILGSDGLISFTGIDQGYHDLILSCLLRSSTNEGGHDEAVLTFNGDSGAHYNSQRLYADNTNVVAEASGGANGIEIYRWMPDTTAPAGMFGSCEILVPGYAGSKLKIARTLTSSEEAATAAGQQVSLQGGNWSATDAVTRIDVNGLNANLAAGSEIQLYGRGKLS
jgi:hypothetical protein